MTVTQMARRSLANKVKNAQSILLDIHDSRVSTLDEQQAALKLCSDMDRLIQKLETPL